MATSFTDNQDYRAFCIDQLEDPYPLLDRLRCEDPVHWCAPMGLWLVTRYSDVLEGLRDSRLSTSRSGMYLAPLAAGQRERVEPLLKHVGRWILLTDDPDHGRLRRLVNLAFTPRMLKVIRPGVERLAHELLSKVSSREPFDIVDRFFFPLPATVICDMLGIPREQHESFRLCVEKIAAFTARGGPELVDFADEAQQNLDSIVPMFAQLIRERRQAPRGDMITALAQAQDAGDRLSEEELFAMCVFIFLAGHDTTMHLMANGLLALLQHPDQWQKLKSNVDVKLPQAIEEFLRFDNSVPRAVRRAKQDLEIQGRQIKAGQTVVLMIAAANRDPEQFANPHQFDIDRQPNKHVGFGFGSHFCLGAQLARMEVEIAFRTIIDQMPEIRLANQPVRRKSIMGLRGVHEMVVFAQ